MTAKVVIVMPAQVLAIDIGASGGRHMLGRLADGELTLNEVYRFPNGAQARDGRLCWDADALWGHIMRGLQACKAASTLPFSVGVDTWGVDYALLDEEDKRIGDCMAYRDGRTAPMLHRIADDWLYRRTGIAKQPFNTIYQLMATPPEALAHGRRCLMMPDYFHFLLSGVKANEYTEASTGALIDVRTGLWDQEVLAAAGIPAALFPEPPVQPGTCLGRLRPQVTSEAGFTCDVVLPASHDTGSAFMAVPALDNGAVFLSSGTWSLLGVENDAPIVSEAARLAGFTNEGGYGGKIRFLRNIMGLWMLQSIRHELADRYSYVEMAEMALQGKAYAPVVDVADNRFLAPAGMTAEVRAALAESGAPPPQDLPQLLRCVHHSLAQGYADAIRALENLTDKRFTALHIVGGGSQNRTLNQWTADATGLPVYAGPVEGTALGNVIAQLIAQGHIENLSQARAMIRRDFAVQSYQPERGE
ncbi:MAG: rhamnulokinase [Eubacteriales bacterium]|nr:rhamnulokinase [Eubacteriales bacterium]